MHAPGKAAQGRGEQKQPCPSQEDAFATVKIGEASINRDRHRLGQRSQHDAVNAAEAIELLPGSHAKPARSRLGLRVHERAPGGVSGCRDGTLARRVGGWLSCLAAPTGVHSCRRRRGAAEADPDDPCWITRDLWRAAGCARRSFRYSQGVGGSSPSSPTTRRTTAVDPGLPRPARGRA